MRLLCSQIARLQPPAPSPGVDVVVAGITETEIAFALPAASAIPPSLARGEKIVVTFWDQHGLYRGETVVQRHVKAAMPTLIVSMLREVRTSQHRKLFRVTVKLATVVTVLQTVRSDAKVDDQAITEDFSGGGVRLAVAQPLQAGERVSLEIAITDGAPCLKVAGTVLRAAPHPRSAARWIVSVKFERLNELEQAQIIRALFELQRQQG